jgi:hypothetical protein
MAETLVHTIQFLEDNPYGTFVSGDVVSIYYDPALDPAPSSGSTTGYTVKKNGIPILAGNDVFYQFDAGKIESSANAQICNGTTLIQSVRQITYFPYVFTFAEPDYPSCAVDPNTCDLIVTGTPLIVTASGETNADAELTVTAQSSLPIQYKLGSDFLYNDGTAQSTGYFFGLIPGNYRVYIRDSKNCSTNILVTVGWDDTYGVIYRQEWNDVLGNANRVDILKRAYAGGLTEVVSDSGSPFERSLRGEGVLDKFEPILSVEAICRLLSQTNFQFSQLFSNNPEEFKLNYYKYNPIETPVFTPAVMDDVDDWTDDGSGDVAWGIVAGNPAVTLQNTSNSGGWYTDYAFETNRTYSFDYSFTNDEGGYVFSRIHIDITNSFGADLGEHLVIDSQTPGTFTGTYTFIAPDGASRIVIWAQQKTFVSLAPNTYMVNSFTNETEGEDPGVVDFELKFTGFCLPQQYEEEYTKEPYPVTLRATDGLPSLKDYIFLQDDGQRFNSTMRQIEVVAFILKKLKLNLPIRVACNLYATTMDQTDNDDPLDQAYVDTERYYLTSDEPTLDFVLRAILEPYGASLAQDGGYWNITRVEEKRSAYAYRVFDKNGVYIREGEYDPIVNIDSPSQSNRFMWSDRDQHLQTCPGYGKIILYYDLGLKGNILRNGDFRLKSQYNALTGTYSFLIDKLGFQLVNGGYALTEGYERTSETNVAYLIRSTSTAQTGEAYLQSDTINLKMGVQNTLKIKLRVKLPSPVQSVPYQKVRLRVKYGDFYLTSSGRWTEDVNELVFFIDRFDEYTEVETIAYAPNTSAAQGFDFDVRLYHSFVKHVDFTDYNDLIALNADDVDQLPTGLRKQVSSDQLCSSAIDYFELVESEEDANQNLLFVVTDRGSYNPTATHAFPTGTIARGDTWEISANTYIEWNTYDRNVRIGDKITALIDNANSGNSDDWALNYAPKFIVPSGFLWGTNTKQWAFKSRVRGTQVGNFQFEDGTEIIGGINGSFWIDYINIEYLYNGQAPYDTIIREIQAEPKNKDVLEKKIYHGSFSEVLQTINLSDKRNINFAKYYATRNSVVTANILSFDNVYSGYLRNSDGEGFETWKRDGISEQTSLHAILLNSYAAQYKRPWRKITGTLYSDDRYFSMIDTLKEVNDGNRLYIPISVTIDEKQNTISGEFLELIDVLSGAGSNGSGSSPFTSAFTIGFGSGYN